MHVCETIALFSSLPIASNFMMKAGIPQKAQCPVPGSHAGQGINVHGLLVYVKKIHGFLTYIHFEIETRGNWENWTYFTTSEE